MTRSTFRTWSGQLENRVACVSGFKIAIAFVVAGAAAFALIIYFASFDFLNEHFSKFIYGLLAIGLASLASLFVSKEKLLHLPTADEVYQRAPVGLAALFFVLFGEICWNQWLEYHRLSDDLAQVCLKIPSLPEESAQVTYLRQTARKDAESINKLWLKQRQVEPSLPCA